MATKTEDLGALRVGQTVRIGFAFLSICAFWQLYNNIVPLILTGTFHLGETISGVIMAADNVLGLFLLPLFGTISDKCKSKMGRRKPFVLFGTIAAVVLMVLIPLIDNSYFANPSAGKKILFIAVLGALLVAMGTYRSPAVALMPDLTPMAKRSLGNAIINLMGAIGGIIYVDFRDNDNPIVKKVDVDFNSFGYKLCITDTGGSHSNLTGEYTSITKEMKDVAQFFGKPVLRDVTVKQIFENITELRKKFG
ncbi:MAG: MFS transporter, partial [Clostridia bacterium]|nr:MFS transporter [Clostridia bacterium]